MEKALEFCFADVWSAADFKYTQDHGWTLLLDRSDDGKGAKMPMERRVEHHGFPLGTQETQGLGEDQPHR